MAKKVSSVGKTIKKKVAKPKASKEAVGVKKTRQMTKSNLPVISNDVSDLRKELKQRTDELAIINSVQEGLAAKLEFNEIIKLVGGRLYEIFKPDILLIGTYNPADETMAFPYGVAEGEKAEFPAAPIGGFSGEAIQTRKTIVVNENMEERSAQTGSYIMKGEKNPLSLVYVPIIASDNVLGAVSLQSYQKENAFSESDIRLLETLCNAMSMALQNAQSFKAEQERVAELQIINSIQQGLAAELDFQAIVDLVGDKLSEVLNTGDLGIRWYDEKDNIIHYLYEFEHGTRLSIEPRPPTPKGSFEQMRKDRKPIVWNTEADYVKNNSQTAPGTDRSKSLITVPIISSDRVLGTIHLENYESENAYGESEIRLLTTIAASLGTALENARLFDETQRLFKAEQERVAELQIINSIQQGLAAELDFQAIVDLVGDKLREVFNTPDLYINWYDEKANLVHPLYQYEHSERLTVEPYHPTPGGILETMVKNRQPIVFNTATDTAGGITRAILPGTDQSKSSVTVPIISSDRVLGTISLENYERENAYGESELRLLTTIAASLGTALENARLFDETQRLLKITEERAEELAIINSVQAGLASQLDIQAIFDLVGDKVQETFDAQSVTIITYDRQTKLLAFPYIIEKGQRLTQEPFPLSETGFTPVVMRTRQPLMINEDMVKRMEEVGSFVVGGGGEAPKSGIWVPLVIGEEARGVISIQNIDREHAFDESDFRLLTTLASSLSVAFENARLFDETQRLLKITEERAKELVIINSVQEGLASKLDIQSIYNLLGEKIREVFDAQVVTIVTFDHEKQLNILNFGIEKGELFFADPYPLTAGHQHLIRTRVPIFINQNWQESMRGLGFNITVVPDTEMPKSHIIVPLVVDQIVKGSVSLQNVDRENAFTESDVRLLQTLANSMSVALENARLFDETQRLL
ncbi:MAG TPA: hypothetical protein DIW23_03790, partial [Anaerolineae bacterium]|nr:hypothetical protein [Anaerolineae bacterium]